jgi:hypothetical protein
MLHVLNFGIMMNKFNANCFTIFVGGKIAYPLIEGARGRGHGHFENIDIKLKVEAALMSSRYPPATFRESNIELPRPGRNLQARLCSYIFAGFLEFQCEDKERLC